MNLLMIQKPLMASSGLISLPYSLDGDIGRYFTNRVWQGAGSFASLIWGTSLSL